MIQIKAQRATEDRQRFQNEIDGYDFFLRGAMDVGEHRVLLAQAFVLDGVRDASSPNAIFEHLTALADHASSRGDVAGLHRARFGPDARFDTRIHPEGQLTLLHPATALMIFDEYVVSLG